MLGQRLRRWPNIKPALGEGSETEDVGPALFPCHLWLYSQLQPYMAE